MTPQELKNSILQMAIQGKLVEQREEEGTALDLICSLPKLKKPMPPISKDEQDFEIPDNWEWAYLGELFMHNTGKAQNSSDTSKGIVRKFITTSNLYWNRFDFTKVKEMPFTEQELERCTVQKGDLLVCEGGDCGRSAIWTYDEEVCIQNHVHRLRPFVELDIRFYYYLLYLYKFTGKLKGRGVAIQGLSTEAIHKVICPVPPLAEQKRIVAKIEELLPYIDRYEQAWSRLEEFNKRFPDDMQKSILQMAIQGKLVEQRPEEGTGEELYQQIQQEKQRLIKAGTIKKEKPLPEITEDEIPFDIPDGWKWVRLNDISLMIGDIDHKMPPAVERGGIPYISPLNFTKNGGIDYAAAKRISFDDYEVLARKCKPSRNDIIFPRYGTIGVVRIIDTDEPLIVSYSCCTIKNLRGSFMDYRYVFTVLRSRLVQDEITKYVNKTTQPNVGLQSIKQFLFPLPPLAEQKRIVEKLEQLLPLCERLK